MGRSTVVTIDAASPRAAALAADQGLVWEVVAMKHARASSTSRTGALHDLYAREASDVVGLGTA
jgi:hypothetical protein